MPDIQPNDTVLEFKISECAYIENFTQCKAKVIVTLKPDGKFYFDEPLTKEELEIVIREIKNYFEKNKEQQ